MRCDTVREDVPREHRERINDNDERNKHLAAVLGDVRDGMSLRKFTFADADGEHQQTQSQCGESVFTQAYLQIKCGVNFIILDSGHVWALATKVPGLKHISNPDFAPFLN